MRDGRTFRCAVFISLALSVYPLAFSSADLVASDNADNNPSFNPGDNGGYGFLGWAELYEGNPAEMYTTDAIDEGSRSWGIRGSYALGRGLSNSMAGGTWTLLALHDADNGGFSGFNLKSTTNLTFEADEIFRFGDDPSQIEYDGTGIYISTDGGDSYVFLDCGFVDISGDTLAYSVSWNSAGTYSLSVNNQTETIITNFSGTLPSFDSVAMLGVAIEGTDLNESLTFDDYNVSVIPEPGAAAILILGIWFMRRTFRGRVRKSAERIIRV